MTVRWASVIVDSHDVKTLASWWSETLGWPITYESDDEVELEAPVSVDLTDAGSAGPVASVRPPSLTFVPVTDEKTVKNRLHIDLAPGPDDDQAAAVQALLDRGATRADVGQGADVTWVVLADPEGNEFCVLSPRP